MFYARVQTNVSSVNLYYKLRFYLTPDTNSQFPSVLSGQTLGMKLKKPNEKQGNGAMHRHFDQDGLV